MFSPLQSYRGLPCSVPGLQSSDTRCLDRNAHGLDPSDKHNLRARDNRGLGYKGALCSADSDVDFSVPRYDWPLCIHLVGLQRPRDIPRGGDYALNACRHWPVVCAFCEQ